MFPPPFSSQHEMFLSVFLNFIYVAPTLFFFFLTIAQPFFPAGGLVFTDASLLFDLPLFFSALFVIGFYTDSGSSPPLANPISVVSPP